MGEKKSAVFHFRNFPSLIIQQSREICVSVISCVGVKLGLSP